MNVYLPYTAILPSEYQEVEYIESSGTQYINTGYNPSNKTKVVHKGYNVDNWIYGVGQQGSYYSLALYNGDGTHYRARCRSSSSGNSTVDSSVTCNTTSHIFECSQIDGLYIDGTKIGTFTQYTYTETRSIYLFGWNSNGTFAGGCNGRIYYMKISEDGTLVRNFVPCYRKSDSVIGLYDLVNNQFYTNAGTGTFTKGNDVTMAELKNAYIGEVWTPGSNTVGYWTFDDQNVNQITDVSGNGNNLTGNTMPTYVQVLGSNYAGNYNNVSSGGTPYYSGTIDSNKFTVMLWLKVLATGQQYITNMINGSIGNLPALIYGYNSGQIELYSYQNGNTYRSTIKSSTALDTWYCVGFTRNGTTMKTYLNGAYVASVTIPVQTGLVFFHLGSTGTSTRFHGQIGEAVLESGVEEDLSYMSNYYNLTKSTYGL